MSTKIYTGFRFRDTSWALAHKRIMAFRLELAVLVHDDEARQVAVRACEIFDKRTVGAEPIGDTSPYVMASLELMEANRKDRPTFDLALFPYGIRERIYGMTFGRPQHDELWRSKPFVEPWGYWNNTDRPDDVSGREWGVRRRTWDKILVGYASPAMSGFLAKCIAQYGDMVTIADVLKRLPTLDQRVRSLAIPRLAEERGVKSPSDYSEFARWARSPEGAKRLAEIGKTIRPALVHRITAKQLNPA